MQRVGVKLPRQPDPNALPDKPPLPDIHTGLRRQIKRDARMKERRENTAWDMGGPRYQVTNKPLLDYHAGRLVGSDGYVCPTRFGGVRVRHHEPLRDAHGFLLGEDERIFEKQRAKAMAPEPLWMETLPRDFGVYDRLCNVTTTSRLLGKIEFADDMRRAKTASGKRKGSTPGFVPL